LPRKVELPALGAALAPESAGRRHSERSRRAEVQAEGVELGGDRLLRRVLNLRGKAS
jgi:hypothetical protein